MSKRLAAVDRRTFMTQAAAIGATVAWSGTVQGAAPRWTERRELYPEGVASGDPEPDSVLLWTRRPFAGGGRRTLIVQVAKDPDFRRLVAQVRAPVLAESDWTCRVLVAGLKPRSEYWYRFIDETGAGSRVGRTITAPLADDPRPVRFAFVSCQSVNEGAQHAFRRMIFEDKRAAPPDRLNFVLHLGDFIYEIVEYPDEVPHRYDRTIFDIGRVPDSRKVDNFHVPTTLEGYRTVYRAHIHDPDIQDARAYFPFVCIGDNHEFSWQGWQSFIKYDGKAEPAQKLRVDANQAWWEYIPSRVRKRSGPSLERFDPPQVVDAPVLKLDDDGFGDEVNNRIAVDSMISYRAMRFGRHVQLIMTDFHSYCMEDPGSRREADAFTTKDYPLLYPEEVLQILDGGRAHDRGRPPSEIEFNGAVVPNFRKDDPPITFMGNRQKAWLKDQLSSSDATWKIWAATNGTLDARTDPKNLPPALAKPWPGKGHAVLANGDFSVAFRERAEVYDHVRDAGITGFVIVSGDRHSFWAGYAAKALPPASFDPVGISFITGSISAVGYAEALEHGLKNHPLRALYTVERSNGAKEATINISLKHGVRTALEYARSGNLEKARALSNPDNAPHVEFVDMGGHGYSVVTAASDHVETEFVCIPRPVQHNAAPDGGPLRYRVVHRSSPWAAGERPKLEQRLLEGDPGLSI